jgi:hypothetical protein
MNPVQTYRPKPSDLIPTMSNQETKMHDIQVPLAQLEPTPMPVSHQPEPTQQTVPIQRITRSGRISRLPSALMDFPMVVYEATQNIQKVEPDMQWMSPVAFSASSDPDVLYMHEAMKDNDKAH